MIINTLNNKLEIELMYIVEDYFTLNIEVKSSDFQGKTRFCINKSSIVLFIEELSRMNNTLKGKCEIQDYDSDSYILLEMESYGHIAFTGQIGGSHEEQYMKFRFKSDQTILLTMIQLFKSFLV